MAANFAKLPELVHDGTVKLAANENAAAPVKWSARFPAVASVDLPDPASSCNTKPSTTAKFGSVS